MTSIQRTSDGFILDAGLLADAFSLTEDEIKKLMREGVITSRCENGIDEDAGRWRLTFYYGDRLCRYIVDDKGRILKRTAFPIKPRQHDPSVQPDICGSPRAGSETNA